jgi:hypothetical protein
MSKMEKLNIVIIEDSFAHFDLLSKGLVENYNCFPDISQSKVNYQEFKRLFWAYLSDPTKQHEINLKEYIIPFKPDLFIVDISLFVQDISSKLDFTGGYLRFDFLAKHFPGVPAILLTLYFDHQVASFKVEGDIHIYKDEYNEIYPGPRMFNKINAIINSICPKTSTL